MLTRTAPLRRSAALLSLSLCVLACAGCGRTVDVSTRSLRQAERTWNEANIRDYDLEWRSSGESPGHYLVYVRDGRVRQVRRVLETPSEVRANQGRNIIEAHPGDPDMYGVDGLFRIMTQELDEAQSDTPFGAGKNARVILKFTPDDILGYPRSYRRDVMGSRRSVALDVIRFDPHPKREIPPLPTS